MAIVTLGILAHVDAGKTSLTEQILFQTGVIPTMGSVDKGTTQTDSLELERARGITIKAAVATFQLGETTVHLIDTPGHADFIAEVERALHVLDGVVLVISAVEGVQPQTRRLARAIRAAGLPMLIFVNKIDRLGARAEPLIPTIQQKLGVRGLAMSSVEGIGTRETCVLPYDRHAHSWLEAAADLLAESSEAIIAEFERSGRLPSASVIACALREQVASGDVVPIFFGSAITGAGVAELLHGIADWLPTFAAGDDAESPVDGHVFKIERRPSGEKVVLARLTSGVLANRQRVTLLRHDASGSPEEIEERVTGVDRFIPSANAHEPQARAGEIVALHGLRQARIGDRLGRGEHGPPGATLAFAPPALESVVHPLDPGQMTRMRTALEQLAEQDPLISLRQRNDAGDVSLRLYGDVQKEVVSETLLREFGISVVFGATETVCIERPVATGSFVETIFTESNPFYGTVGITIEPAEVGSAITYNFEPGSLPWAFYRVTEETVRDTLAQGLHGWSVTDCLVTLTHAGYSSVMSTGADFRKLTPLVVMQALHNAGTEVCEPIETLELEAPEETFGAVCGALIQSRATMRSAFSTNGVSHLVCDVPTAEMRALEHLLPGLTRGEGDWESRFAGYTPVVGDPPTRPRIGPNPLNRAHYLAEVGR